MNPLNTGENKKICAVFFWNTEPQAYLKTS